MLSAVAVNGQPHPHEQGDLTVPWWSFTKTVLATTALSLVRDRPRSLAILSLPRLNYMAIKAVD
jgi:hypothetical protein